MSEPISKVQFEQHLTEAVSITLDALDTFELFYCLTSQRQKKKYQKVFENHPRVFACIKPALFSMLVLSLHKLLEDADDPISLYRCVSMARQLSLISRDQQKDLKIRINGVKPIWQKVGVFRNNLVAHRDHSISVKKVFQTANISPKELRNLVLLYCEVLNELIGVIGKKPFDPKGHSFRLFTEFEGVLDALLKTI